MIDSHAHVTDPHLADDIAGVSERAQAAGVTGWIEIGTNLAVSQEAVALAKSRPNVWASVGVHPDEVAELTPTVWQELERLAREPRVVAIGEVGFDFYRKGSREEQTPALERFISLATAVTKPVIFHVRDGEDVSAHEALLAVLSDRPVPGVIHTFSGTWEQAERYLALGFYLSISGVVTFKKPGAMAEVAGRMPLDRLLLETDSPYLTPEPHRGQRNEPAYVAHVAATVARLREISVEEVVEVTLRNTQKLFTLSDL